jgi:hypothetical protein
MAHMKVMGFPEMLKQNVALAIFNHRLTKQTVQLWDNLLPLFVLLF